METKKKERLDEYIEMLFDDIQDNHETAALWLHAKDGADGSVCTFKTVGSEKREALFIKGLAASLSDDEALLYLVTQAVALALAPRIYLDLDDEDDLLKL